MNFGRCSLKTRQRLTNTRMTSSYNENTSAKHLVFFFVSSSYIKRQLYLCTQVVLNNLLFLSTGEEEYNAYSFGRKFHI